MGLEAAFAEGAGAVEVVIESGAIFFGEDDGIATGSVEGICVASTGFVGADDRFIAVGAPSTSTGFS